MTSRWTETMVGAFVILSLLAFVFLALNVSGLALTQSSSTYRVQAFFANVGGLTNRAEITLAGVAVGNVRQIEIDREEKNALVTMDIHGDIDFLPTDTSAAILTSGLLGEKYIGLQLGANEETMRDGDFILDTQSAIVLEDLIGRFLVSAGRQ